jgi:integrase
MCGGSLSPRGERSEPLTMGLRRGEIVGLRRVDVDLDKRVLYVRRQTQRRRGVLYDDDPKGRRRRAVPIPAMCIAPLRWHRMRQTAAKLRAEESWDGDVKGPGP